MKTERNILSNKIYLYITEFFCGIAVMAVELGASRLLAPYFSSSQIVWTIIIGTIMIAMALGNIYGGRSADKNPNPDKLYRRILLASVWIAAIPVVGKYIIVGIAGALVFAIDSNFLIIAAFLACMVIFVFPLFLLGTVTPSLVKYSVDSLDNSGKTVGMLGAYNTVGSIIGTFLPTFITIPAVGTSITFFIFAGILMLIALIYFFSKMASLKRCVVSVVIFILCVALGNSDSFAFWENNLVYEGESVYNYLQVQDDGDRTILSTNVLFGVQSVTMKDHSLTGMYYDYAMAAPLMAGVTEQSGGDMLILGMGTGTYARQCTDYFDGLNIDGVEIDEKITKLSKKYFDLPNGVNTVNYDGRAYLQAQDKKYDVIMVDAYQDITIPFQMSSAEFFKLVKAHLNDGGVMVVNFNMYSDKEGSITDWLSDTIASVFPNVAISDVPGSTNHVLFASEKAGFTDTFGTAVSSLKNKQFKSLMQTVEKQLKKYEAGGRILTDDKAPVELLGMNMIDTLITDELSYYKELFKNEGFGGLLKEIMAE